MNKTSLAQKARAVERDIFGALIGTLAGVVVARVLLFFNALHLFVLALLVFVGAWTGAFVAHIAANRSTATINSVRAAAGRFRTICFKLILWMLGSAAVLGVLSVLTGSFQVVGRVAGTAAITGLAASLLVPLLAYLDDDRKWRIGFLGVASVFAAYFLVLPSIWEIGFRDTEAMMSGMTISLMLPVGLIAMQLTYGSRTRVAGWAAALLYLAALSIFLFSVWADQIRFSENMIGTGFSVLGFGMFAVASLVNSFVGDGRRWRWIGVAFSVLAAVVVIFSIWNNADQWPLVVTLASVAAVVAHANLSMLPEFKGTQIWWRYATILAAIVTAVALDIETWMTQSSYSMTFVGRIAMAGGIVTSTGTLAMLIFMRLNHKASKAESLVDLESVATEGPLTQITLYCPRCGKSQTIPLSESYTCQCGTTISIQVTDGSEA